MDTAAFDNFFSGSARHHLNRAIADALLEDGPDLTTNAVFPASAILRAEITAKQRTVLAGLPCVPIILEETAQMEPGEWSCEPLAREGTSVTEGTVVAQLGGSARVLLRAERVILNFIMHLSGIANLVATYCTALQGTGIRLLDTRKTLPGLRYPEKYAVLAGGGCNHRKNLGALLMVKDNHIDAAGGIAGAVACLRSAYDPSPPIEVECRTLEEVSEAVQCGVDRIMLDNMLDKGGLEMMQTALALVPPAIEVEISGGITLESIRRLKELPGPRRPDFVSVGRLTHSAPATDFSMRIYPG